MNAHAESNRPTRRAFVKQGGILVASSLLIATPSPAAEKPKNEEEEDVSPPEDLMREHGVLKRVLLIYGEAIRRLESNTDLPPAAVQRSAGIIRTFIEDYHEKLEEDFLFPRFRKARTSVDLVDVLLQQHQAGRRLTDITLQLAQNEANFRKADERRALANALRQFVRMYEPHEAREDTVLFPELRKVVSKHEFGALGEDFEKKEHELFGAEGFEKFVAQVAEVEKQLGIYDLAQFTPKV